MTVRRRAKAVPKEKAVVKAKPKAKPKIKPTTAARPRTAARAAKAAPGSDDFAFALGSAAHEIKNGLGPLGMTLQIVERKLLDGEAVPPGDLAFARAQVRRLSQLVNDLLDVTHVDTDQLPLRVRPADLVVTIADALDTFARGNVRHVARVLPSTPCPRPSIPSASCRSCSTCSRTPRSTRRRRRPSR